MQLTEIRVAGFAEQGVILLAKMIAKAISGVKGYHAIMTQDFNQDFGGLCSTQVVVSDQPVYYHHVSNPDILVAMSQEAYDMFFPELRPGGLVIIEEELVRVTGTPEGARVYGIPAMRLAEEASNRAVLNIVMLGFFGAVAGVLQRESLRKSVENSVPSASLDLNLKAFDQGYDYGLQHLPPRLLKVLAFNFVQPK
ncbi:MAG: 2-oxoacid:acceptor oxidoreductase family protein [Candidatus Korobacteraceae bacterium]|jgi:2-oxoglutarate ferredoxin oxidoreductase subunit gamma